MHQTAQNRTCSLLEKVFSAMCMLVAEASDIYSWLGAALLLTDSLNGDLDTGNDSSECK